MACALKIMPGKVSLPRSTYVGGLILIAKSLKFKIWQAAKLLHFCQALHPNLAKVSWGAWLGVDPGWNCFYLRNGSPAAQH